MDFGALTCPQCSSKYNQNAQPRILPSCGHTLCAGCLQKMLDETLENVIMCPFDNSAFTFANKTIEVFPLNFALNKILADQNNREVCKIHEKELKIYCITDKCKICNYCVQYGSHKDHKTELIKKIQNDAEQKIVNYKNQLKDLDANFNKVKDTLKHKKESMRNFVKEKIQGLKESLEKKEQQLLAEISFFFDVEGIKVEEVSDQGSGYRKNMEDMLGKLNNIIKEKQILEIEEEESLIDKTGSLKELVDDYSQSLHQNIEEIFRSLEAHLSSDVNNKLSKVNFPVKTLADRLNEYWKKAKSIAKPSLKTHTSLKSLFNFEYVDNSLTISPRNIMEGSSVFNDGMGIDNYERATSLELKFGGAKDEPSKGMLFELLDSLKRFKLITKLGMNFSESNIRDQDLLSICSSILNGNANLLEFNLDISDSEIGDQGVMIIATKMLQKLTSLQKLCLDLSLTKITDRSMEALTETVVPCLRNLEYLELELDFCEISEQGLTRLFEKDLTKIKAFILSLEGTRISDVCFEIFSKVALPNMKDLEHLEIHLYSLDITSQGMIGLLQVEIPNLKILKLDLEKTKISDEFLTLFGTTAFSQMKSLEVLEIKLGWTEVTDQGVSSLLKADIENIRSLTIDLKHTQVSDLSITEFENSQTNVKNLKHLDLNLEGTMVSDSVKNTMELIQKALTPETQSDEQ